MAHGVTPEVVLSLDRVGRKFGRRQAFADVCADARSGSTLVIAGANGSGKSTLLKIVAGVLAPTSGAVTLAVDGAHYSPADRRRVIGYVSPDLALYAELTAVENLLFFGRIRGIALTHDDLAALLDRVGLRGRGSDPVGTYSSGMRQRLKYAFALMHRPPLLLLDEPTANLDTEGCDMVRTVIEAQRGLGLAIVATNEACEVEWGDAVVHLGDSRN